MGAFFMPDRALNMGLPQESEEESNEKKIF